MYHLFLMAAGLCAAWVGGWFWPPPAPVRGQPELRDDAFRPTWAVGDRWLVETESAPVQASRDAATPARTVRWQFEVKARERLAGQDCFRVEVRCPDAPNGPVTTLWADARSLALRQVRTEVTVQGRPRVITESYHFAGGQPAPVLAPFSALPLDMPLLIGGRAKGAQKFTFEAVAGPLGQKALGDIRFAFEVEQRTEPIDAAKVKAMLGTRKLDGRGSVLEVRLEAAGRPAVRQLWQAGQPWPVYSVNGPTATRLVKVERAEKPRKEKP